MSQNFKSGGLVGIRSVDTFKRCLSVELRSMTMTYQSRMANPLTGYVGTK